MFVYLEKGKNLENNIISRTISLVNNVFKLFTNLTSRAQETQFYPKSSSLRDMIAVF